MLDPLRRVLLDRNIAAALFVKYGFDKEGLLPYVVFCNALCETPARWAGGRPGGMADGWRERGWCGMRACARTCVFVCGGGGGGLGVGGYGLETTAWEWRWQGCQGWGTGWQP